jgi:hypothetical protein
MLIKLSSAKFDENLLSEIYLLADRRFLAASSAAAQ